jgi:hypothetical protein
MGSTYSPSLRIELIGNGEQVGIWGETTNSNLGTILENAITGNTNVLVTSANQVLSVSNGAPDQSRNAVLVLTTSGAVTADFNIFAPPVNKTYIVVNNSAYNATIYNSTIQGNITPAGTGVEIKAGKTTQVWSNGTNFYVSATSVDIPLPASQGGTGLISPTANSVLIGNGASAMQLVAPGPVNNLLQSNGTTWISSPSGGGTVANGALLETTQTMNIVYTVTAGKNAMTISPFTITNGGSLTVPNGSRFVTI